MSDLKLKEKNISQIILKYLDNVEIESSILKGNLLNETEKQFIIDNPNAFLIGLISDQSVKAEIAWSLPYKLYERLNTFNFQEIINNYSVDSLEKVLKEKPSLHRYPSKMSIYILEAMKKVFTEYNSSAENIWKNKSAKEIVNALESFKGISHKKASLGTLLLVRDLNVDILDKYNIDIAYDIHIRRLFLRLGLVENDVQEEILQSAKRLYPEFPGRLTTAFWSIGREICHATEPSCLICPLFSECDRNFEKTKTLK